MGIADDAMEGGSAGSSSESDSSSHWPAVLSRGWYARRGEVRYAALASRTRIALRTMGRVETMVMASRRGRTVVR